MLPSTLRPERSTLIVHNGDARSFQCGSRERAGALRKRALDEFGVTVLGGQSLRLFALGSAELDDDDRLTDDVLEQSPLILRERAFWAG
jgi:hypothetical protein